MITISSILICTDGQENTAKAEEYAVTLAQKFQATLAGLYVVDPFLKKFTNEIYAINRDACREHLDESLKNEGMTALEQLSLKAEAEGLRIIQRMRYGDPEEEILHEIKEGAYDVVVMGGKVLKGWRENFESFKLSEKIFKKCPLPLLVVR